MHLSQILLLNPDFWSNTIGDKYAEIIERFSRDFQIVLMVIVAEKPTVNRPWTMGETAQVLGGLLTRTVRTIELDINYVQNLLFFYPQKKRLLICFGFAIVAVTISIFYVNGMDTKYQTLQNEKEHELRELYLASYKTTAKSTSVDTRGSKTSSTAVSNSTNELRTNGTIGPPKQTRNPPSLKKQEAQGNNTTESVKGNSTETKGLQKFTNASDSRSVFKRLPRDGQLAENETLDPLYDHHGYISVLDPKKKLNLHCTQCALVSSSGQLLQSHVGYLIDEADCIFRMNDAPVPSYEEDVGSRTTVRVIGHAATYNLKNKRQHLFQESSSRYVVGWGPAKPMGTTGKGYAFNNLKEMAIKYKDVNFFYLTQEQMDKADEMFEAETGKPRMGSGTYLSTGWFTMLLARQSCDEIHVYGMVDDSYCQTTTNKIVPYHYYDKLGRKECDYYRIQEKGKKGFHRFITEKAIFARWAHEQPRIYFHAPERNP